MVRLNSSDNTFFPIQLKKSGEYMIGVLNVFRFVMKVHILHKISHKNQNSLLTFFLTTRPVKHHLKFEFKKWETTTGQSNYSSTLVETVTDILIPLAYMHIANRTWHKQSSLIRLLVNSCLLL